MKDTWIKPKRVGLNVAGRDWWGRGRVKMETIVLEQQLKKHILIFELIIYT